MLKTDLTFKNAYTLATKSLPNKDILTIKAVPHVSDYARLFIHTSRKYIGQCCKLSLRDKMVFMFINLPTECEEDFNRIGSRDKFSSRNMSRGDRDQSRSNFAIDQIAIDSINHNSNKYNIEDYIIGIASFKAAGYIDFSEMKERSDTVCNQTYEDDNDSDDNCNYKKNKSFLPKYAPKINSEIFSEHYHQLAKNKDQIYESINCVREFSIDIISPSNNINHVNTKKGKETLNFLNTEFSHILRYILIKPAYRQQNLGQYLVAFLETRMKISCRGFEFPVRVEAVPRAVKFFERFGYTKVGSKRNCGKFTNNSEGYMRDNYFKVLQYMEKDKF